MLGELLGSVNKERVLVYLLARERGYAREIARVFDAPLFPIQKALEGLESAGVVVSRVIGRAREYEFSPRYPARSEVKSLVQRALDLYPPEMQERLVMVRSRPRRKGKRSPG